MRLRGDCVKISALVPIDPNFWTQRRVLITGHTGFKGAWLSLWLQAMGADVSGFARAAPAARSLFGLAGVGAHTRQHAVDVRDASAVRAALGAAAPEIVFHLAAQPTVRRSLRDPVGTFAVNVMGTVNVLDAVRAIGEQVRAVVIVTSERCYANPTECTRPLAESEPLGGGDPYSSSKAAAELVAAAYRRSYFSHEHAPRIATVRSGNVIGGGDWGEERLFGDVMRAVQSGQQLHVRNPLAVRRWQHVLNPLSGYLQLAERLCEHARAARAWNFGPPADDARAVGWVVERLGGMWGGALRWRLGEPGATAEAPPVALDSEDAGRGLGWSARWDLEQALAATVKWHRAHLRGADMRAVSLRQIETFASTTL
jgi:CDP-glucose 4,6-dehydratase